MKSDILKSLATAFCISACQPALGDVSELPVTADRCTMSYALTGQVIAGCEAPNPAATTTRALPTDEQGYFVHFALNSNTLSQKAKAHLARLNDLLTGPLSHLCIKLVGHTDTTGPSNYNMKLSQRRAQSVYQHLTVLGGIQSLRLAAEGWGETQPLPNRSGTDPKNRRVEILAKPRTSTQCHL